MNRYVLFMFATFLAAEPGKDTFAIMRKSAKELAESIQSQGVRAEVCSSPFNVLAQPNEMLRNGIVLFYGLNSTEYLPGKPMAAKELGTHGHINERGITITGGPASVATELAFQTPHPDMTRGQPMYSWTAKFDVTTLIIGRSDQYQDKELAEMVFGDCPVILAVIRAEQLMMSTVVDTTKEHGRTVVLRWRSCNKPSDAIKVEMDRKAEQIGGNSSKVGVSGCSPHFFVFSVEGAPNREILTALFRALRPYLLLNPRLFFNTDLTWNAKENKEERRYCPDRPRNPDKGLDPTPIRSIAQDAWRTVFRG
jgi:hypothetical protein